MRLKVAIVGELLDGLRIQLVNNPVVVTAVAQVWSLGQEHDTPWAWPKKKKSIDSHSYELFIYPGDIKITIPQPLFIVNDTEILQL